MIRGFGGFMDYTPVEILLIEDNPSDIKLTLKALQKHSLANKVTVLSNLDIDNDLKIDAGELDVNGYTVDISGSLDISGKLTMTLPASQVNAGYGVYWNAGSSSNITDGLIRMSIKTEASTELRGLTGRFRSFPACRNENIIVALRTDGVNPVINANAQRMMRVIIILRILNLPLRKNRTEKIK